MSEWISVKDRMPDFDQVVMVCWPSGFDGRPLYSWGARIDDGDGWLWGIKSGWCGWVAPGDSADDNGIEVDDDYPVQFWKPLDPPPALISDQ